MNPLLLVLFIVTAFQCANAAFCLLAHLNTIVTAFAIGGAVLLLTLSAYACVK